LSGKERVTESEAGKKSESLREERGARPRHPYQFQIQKKLHFQRKEGESERESKE